MSLHSIRITALIMRPSTKKRTFIGVLLILTAISAYLVYTRRSALLDTVLHHQDDQPREKRNLNHVYEMSTQEDLPKNEHHFKPRQNIIIVAHGSSGSSITGDIFNQHPSVFYLHEPLQTVERIHGKEKSSGATYGGVMADVLRRIFSCNFTDAMAQDFKYYYHNFSPRASVAIGSPPLCPFHMSDPRWDPEKCPPIKAEILNKACRKQYKVTVIKILIDRIHEANIKNVLDHCMEPGIDCKVIFLVRDPRAIIASSRSHGFFGDDKAIKGRPKLRRYSKKKCQRTEDNLAVIQSLSSFWSKRIMIQRYEDFGFNPLKALSRYLRFAGLPEHERLRVWLTRRTHPKDYKGIHKECDLKSKYHKFCEIDDAAKAANRWRWQVPFEDIVIMEEYCHENMRLVGYKPINGSQKLLSNLSISLSSENYEKRLEPFALD